MLPDGIPPNQEVRIPGILKALILHETKPQAPGNSLCADETVSLLAYSKRLSRAIPEFSGRHHIKIQYPLKLGPPRYLDCVTKDDQARVSWTVSHTLICHSNLQFI